MVACRDRGAKAVVLFQAFSYLRQVRHMSIMARYMHHKEWQAAAGALKTHHAGNVFDVC